jgi:hypothetical protein
MKNFLLLMLFSTVLMSASDCSNKKAVGKEYKAKLEIAGICMNYTIRLLEENTDSLAIEATWMDEQTAKTYNNVFALGNPCSFPQQIKQGDEFSFTIDTATQQGCAVCEAFYPTPGKRLSIKVIEK